MPTTEIPHWPPVAARNYPGFLGALFLVLLRIAIGWHFLYEGLEKVESTAREAAVLGRALPAQRDRSARALLPRDGARRQQPGHARPGRLKASWADDVERIAKPLRVRPGPAGQGRGRSSSRADVWADILVQRPREQPRSPREVRSRAGRGAGGRAEPRGAVLRAGAGRRARQDLDADRKELTAALVAHGEELRDAAVAKLATPEQQEAAGPYAPP